MNLKFPRKPTGTDSQSIFMIWVWDMLTRYLLINDSSTVKVNYGSQGIILKAIAQGNSQSGPLFFPFKIYTAQGGQIPEGADPEAADRTFMVRAGRFENDVFQGDACDGYDTDPDSNFIPQKQSDGSAFDPIIVPDGETWEVWIELTVLIGPQLRYGEDPTNDPDSINQWTTFPEADGIHFRIGTIDAGAIDGDGNTTVIVRQLMRADWIPALKVTGCDKTGAPVVYHIEASIDPPAEEP